MFKVRKSIDIDFAHHVAGHDGACINLHGHTWKFEVGLMSTFLDNMGFVVDFKQLKQRVLEPVHLLLDHSLALNQHTIEAITPQLMTIGQVLVSTRQGVQASLTPGLGPKPTGYKFLNCDTDLAGARQMIIGGIKIASFPFSPTSERLAEWVFRLAQASFEPEEAEEGVVVEYASVFETLHPVQSVATFTGG